MAKPFEEILTEMVSNEVDFVLVGGFAINAHGHRRNTFDLDLIARFDRPNVEKLVSALQKFGFSPRMPVNPIDLSSAEKRAERQSRNMAVCASLKEKTLTRWWTCLSITRLTTTVWSQTRCRSSTRR